MFTGLVKEIGIVKKISRNTEGASIEIACKTLLPEIAIDDSVSVNGACQTAVKVTKDTFIVQAVHTTLEKTTLGNLKSGDEVNLELAMKLSDRMGGHIVQGHVNDKGQIANIRNTGNNYIVTVRVAGSQMKYIVKEGSVTLEGISLTISEVFREDCSFNVSIIPHTWSNTVLKNRKVGSLINVEVDILGKYIENLLFYGQKANNGTSSITEEWLRGKGF